MSNLVVAVITGMKADSWLICALASRDNAQRSRPNDSLGAKAGYCCLRMSLIPSIADYGNHLSVTLRG
jgi:hypothetical protein